MMIEVNYVHFHNLNRNVLDLGKQVRELAEENARLKEEAERYRLASIRVDVGELHAQFNRALFDVALAENARLKAEVERLTKAGEGNSMWGVVAPYVVPPCIDKYTAKEGKQP